VFEQKTHMGRRQITQHVQSSNGSGESEQNDRLSKGMIGEDDTSPFPNSRQNIYLNSKKSSGRPPMSPVVTEWKDSEQERQYDLTPVGASTRSRRKDSTPSYTIDPFEFSPATTPVHERRAR
jgi:hypothetical protein